MISRANYESIFHQYVGANARSQEDMACYPQQLHQDMEKAELLRSSGRARLLRGGGAFSRSGRLEEVDNMGVEKIGEKYRCNVCGNEIEVTRVGGGTLVCCGEDMELIE